MSRPEVDVGSDEEEEEEELEELENEELKEREEKRKKFIDENGFQYNIYSIWNWNDEDNMKIKDYCREIEKKFNVEIKCLDKSFQLKSHVSESLNQARNKLIELINAKASTAKQILVTPVRSKKAVENVKLEKPPILDDNEKIEPMITEEDLKGLKGVFKFKTRKMNEVLGRDILTRDYWKDICNECKVYGNLDENRWRIEISTGKRKDVKEALKKLELLEDIFLRDQFIVKRISIIHFQNQNTPFNLYFRPRPVKKSDSKGPNVIKATHVIDYTLPKINPQKNNNSDTPNIAMKLRNFNFNKMKEFKEGLEYVRVHRGEVRFYGSLGESLFSNVDYDTEKSLWKYPDLDNLISQNRVKPSFNEIATHNYDLAVKGFTKILGTTPVSTTECFEIRADARNLPQNDYTDVYMYVNVGQVSLDKVTLHWEPLVNVDWTVLNRDFDFSMGLATRHTIRHDVKPFSTFKKKLSVSPGHEEISFEDIEKFLRVKSINFKQISKFKLHNSFVAELACVENVPLERFNNKVLGKSGEGEAHFTIEIYDENYRKKFKQNASLGAGDTVKWTVDDILGEEPNLNNMVEFVKAMLILVEKCHNAKKEQEGQ